jgi:hypothetical protein
LKARAHLSYNNDPTTVTGNVLFYQKDALSPVLIAYSVTQSGIITSPAFLEIRTNPQAATGTDTCVDATVGDIYNPTQVRNQQ